MSELLHREITDQVIKAFYKVYNTLGFGFLEKVYENALFLELQKRGFRVEQQRQLKVFYEAALVGEYFADLIVAGVVILELKAAETLNPAHEAQLMNYLKATEIEVGLLLNFGVKPEFKRKVFTNSRKLFRELTQ
ncbi:MAG: GxxExxY protein [Blastocatellia bacterium]